MVELIQRRAAYARMSAATLARRKRPVAHAYKAEPRELTFKRFGEEKRIAYAEVVAPLDLDSHDEFWREDQIEDLGHRFLASLRNKQIDEMHDNFAGRAVVVESFIVRKGDPDFTPGAWVLGVQVSDPRLWADMKSGKRSGLSLEALVRKRATTVEVAQSMSGQTDMADGHSHTYEVDLDAAGRIVRGATGVTDGHSHPIREKMRTEVVEGHRHTFSMRRPVTEAA